MVVGVVVFGDSVEVIGGGVIGVEVVGAEVIGVEVIDVEVIGGTEVNRNQ